MSSLEQLEVHQPYNAEFHILQVRNKEKYIKILTVEGQYEPFNINLTLPLASRDE